LCNSCWRREVRNLFQLFHLVKNSTKEESVQSLWKRSESLESTTLEVLAINESKLDNTINDGEIHIPGYVSIRKDRTRHGGGVLI
jgi:hypothetical protein